MKEEPENMHPDFIAPWGIAKNENMEDPTVIRVARAIASVAGIDPDIGWRVYLSHAKAAIKALAQADPALHVEGDLDSNTISGNDL